MMWPRKHVLGKPDPSSVDYNRSVLPSTLPAVQRDAIIILIGHDVLLKLVLNVEIALVKNGSVRLRVLAVTKALAGHPEILHLKLLDPFFQRSVLPPQLNQLGINTIHADWSIQIEPSIF
jgi:hypothetical protein